jgi:transglutaminase-like putative cysteine protease
MSAAAKHASATFPGGCLWPNLSEQRRCEALRGWLLHHVRYTDDPPGTELVRHPLEMMDSLIRGNVPTPGDCDDVATLGAALALTCRLQVRWRLIKFGDSGPYTHVYAEVKPPRGGHWVDLDTTRPLALPGLLSNMVRVSDPIPLD